MTDATAPAATDAAPLEADLALIKRIIPHRYPFLLIDKVVGVIPNTRATGVKNVTANEPHFEGHFPERPIMPGVMVIEAMAQTAAVLVGLTVGLADRKALVYFMSIDACRFRRMVVPGDVLHLDVECIRGGGKVWKFNGRATVDGQLAAEAQFAAMLDVKADAGPAA